MVPGLALSITTTDAINVTGVDATKLLTGHVAWAIIGLNTFSTSAVGQWISFMADGTGTDRLFTTSTALSIGTTWIWKTGINLHRWRGIPYLWWNFCATALSSSLKSSGAFTDGTVVASITVGIDTTCTGGTHSHTLASLATVVIRAVIIPGTLWFAAIDGIAIRDKVIKTAALCNSTSCDTASSVWATWCGSARVAWTSSVPKPTGDTSLGSSMQLCVGAD